MRLPEDVAGPNAVVTGSHRPGALNNHPRWPESVREVRDNETFQKSCEGSLIVVSYPSCLLHTEVPCHMLELDNVGTCPIPEYHL